MNLPAFIYLTMVQIHSPTPDMYFYSCKNQGTVRAYHIDTDVFEYSVLVKCVDGDRYIHVDQGNLRRIEK